MRYDLYKLNGIDWATNQPRLVLWRSEVSLTELFRAFGFPTVQNKLRDLRHLKGVFLTADTFLLPAGKLPLNIDFRLI